MESQKGTRNRVEKLRRSVSKYGKSYKPKFTSALGPQVVIHFVSFFVPIIGLIYLSYFNRPLMKLSTRGNDRGCFGVCPIGPGAWVLVAPGRAGSRATGRPIIVRVSPLAHLDTYLHRCQPPLAPSSPPSLAGPTRYSQGLCSFIMFNADHSIIPALWTVRITRGKGGEVREKREKRVGF